MPRELPSFTSGSLSLRGATPDDIPVLMEMLAELADVIQMKEEFSVTPDRLGKALFEEPQHMEAIIAWYKGEPAGFATFLESYHIMSGRLEMSFEMLYVRPAYRSVLVTLAMLVYLLILARSRDYVAVQGFVHDWNTDASEFYNRLNAEALEEHPVRVRLDKVDWSFFRSLLGPEFANLR